MLDTKGPEILTGQNRDNKAIDLQKGQTLRIVTDINMDGDNQKINCSYKNLPNTVSVGSTIFIDDGGLTCKVTEVQDDAVVVICENSFRLKEKK